MVMGYNGCSVGKGCMIDFKMHADSVIVVKTISQNHQSHESRIIIKNQFVLFDDAFKHAGIQPSSHQCWTLSTAVIVID